MNRLECVLLRTQSLESSGTFTWSCCTRKPRCVGSKLVCVHREPKSLGIARRFRIIPLIYFFQVRFNKIRGSSCGRSTNADAFDACWWELGLGVDATDTQVVVCAASECSCRYMSCVGILHICSVLTLGALISSKKGSLEVGLTTCYPAITSAFWMDLLA